MKKSRDNKGYSLVEMIIVLAIVAIVATMALISVGLIRSAKAKEAAVTVDEEVATLITKSKNMKCDREGWEYAARIYENDGEYYYQKGYYNPEDYSYDFTNTDSNGDGKGKSLSPYVQIKFTTEKYYFIGYNASTGKFSEDDPKREYASTKLTDQDVSSLNHNGVASDVSGGGIFLRFNKDGSCATGYGEIIFCKRNGTEVAREYIRVNGSHQTK